MYEVSGGKAAYRVSFGNQPRFPRMEAKLLVKRRMQSGRSHRNWGEGRSISNFS